MKRRWVCGGGGGKLHGRVVVIRDENIVQDRKRSEVKPVGEKIPILGLYVREKNLTHAKRGGGRVHDDERGVVKSSINLA